MASQKPPGDNGVKPDIRDQFKSRSYDAKTSRHDQISGPLGVPGEVQTFRDNRVNLMKGPGDHKGHRIGAQFGAPPGVENLGAQNAKQNAAGGAYYRMEQDWAQKRRSGTALNATVTDVTRHGENRPFGRV